MAKWIFAAFPILLLMPLSAMAVEHCPHGQNPGIRHMARAGSVESVPAARTAAPCPDHSNQPCTINAGMMPKCSMEGCCIKSDGPRSTGLSNRPPANDDHALSSSISPPQTGGRLIGAAPHSWYPPRDRIEPALRPPAA